MSKQQNPVDIVVNPTGETVTRREIPHGIVRTFLSVLPEHAPTHLQLRYDTERLAFAVVQGVAASELGEKVLDWLWKDFPKSQETDAAAFSAGWATFLQNKKLLSSPGDDLYRLVIGALSRELVDGQLWLGWLGTSGFLLLDSERQSFNMEVALVPGEGWSPVQGIVPDTATPHSYTTTLAHLDRLLVFSPELRPFMDDLPYIGQAAVQRVAETVSEKTPVALLDLHPFRIIGEQSEVALRFRWNSPYEATLQWTRAANATGYRIEQASLPTFEDAQVLAELTDARQLLYHVQPPASGEAYYRVVPINLEVPGKPSLPVVVTPVSLIAPVIESIDWSDAGKLRAVWTPIAQADSYEVEASPEQDFDGSHTTTVYQGNETVVEIEPNQMNGWYFRVRSLNTIFAPKDFSSWSGARQAPRRLKMPTFETVTSDKVSWTKIIGASTYEIRETSGKHQYKLVAAVTEPYFNPAKDHAGSYQVRAVRVSGDEYTSSLWTDEIVVGDWKPRSPDDGETPVPGSISQEQLRRIGVMTTEADIVSPDTTSASAPRRNWQLWAAAAALLLIGGLFIGLIGEQRFGILSEPTITPVAQRDREATAVQATLNAQNAQQVATLSVENSQMNARLGENEVQIGTYEAQAVGQASTLIVMESGATEIALNSQATIEALSEQGAELETLQTRLGEQVTSLAQSRATIIAEATGAAQSNSTDVAQTVTAYDATQEALNATIEANATVFAQMAAEVTRISDAEATALNELELQRAAFDSQMAAAEALHSTATVSYQEFQTLEAQANATIVRQQQTIVAQQVILSATPTRTPTPTVTDETQVVLQVTCSAPSPDSQQVVLPTYVELQFNQTVELANLRIRVEIPPEDDAEEGVDVTIEGGEPTVLANGISVRVELDTTKLAPDGVYRIIVLGTEGSAVPVKETEIRFTISADAEDNGDPSGNCVLVGSS